MYKQVCNLYVLFFLRQGKYIALVNSIRIEDEGNGKIHVLNPFERIPEGWFLT